VTINGGTAIDLSAGTTKALEITGTITDNNSCEDVSSVLGYTYRSGVGYTGETTTTYYFDAHNGYVDDWTAWSFESGAFNGNTSSLATTGWPSSSYGYGDLRGKGTDAPTSGSTISTVRARAFGGTVAANDPVYSEIYTDPFSEHLGTAIAPTDESWGEYVSLSTPTGGWNWTKLNNLNVSIYKPLGENSFGAISRIELEVTTSVGSTGCSSSTDIDNNNCYPEVTCTVDTGTCTGSTDASATYTCTANLQYFADPTDANTQYPDDTWLSTLKATDNNSATGLAEVSQGVEMNSLMGFNITTEINYGSLGIGESNDPLDRITTITPTGNIGLDHEVYGPANMCTDFPVCSGSTIPIAYQKYALSESTSYTSATALTTTEATVSTNVPKPTSTSPTTKSIWWGMLVPELTDPGTYDGSITITGMKSDVLNW